MQETTILWADDEIDLLKPHIMLLNEKGYNVKTVTNGNDALDAFKGGFFDLVFLDENMPGLTGLETLAEIKNINPDVPIVLITKNEEEYLMEDAIGSKIDDYLIKPVNPRQVLLTIKKLTENKKLINQKTSMAYQQDFRNLGMTLNDNLSFSELTCIKSWFIGNFLLNNWKTAACMKSELCRNLMPTCSFASLLRRIILIGARIRNRGLLLPISCSRKSCFQYLIQRPPFSS